MKAYIDERPDSTLVEVILTVELTRYLRRCENSGIRIKKVYKERDESKRAIFIESIRTKKKEQLVYVDETGIDTYLYRERASAPRGQKTIGCVSGRKFARQSIVAAKCGNDILASFGYNGTYDTKLFNFWINASRTKTRTNRYYGQCINT